MTALLTNVRPWGGAASDILIEDGTIAAIEPHLPARASGDAIDGRGLLALPGFVNAHAHLDKSWWGKPWVSYGGEATTQGRIAHERAHRDELGIPSPDATSALLRALVAQGTTAFRSHVDVDLGVGLRGIAVVREAVAGLGLPVALEIVAFPQDGVLRRPGVLDLLDARRRRAQTTSAAWTRRPSTGTRSVSSTACSASPTGAASASTSTCTTAASWARSSTS
ncbi:MAG: hypothetical protein ACTHMF_12330 [Leifsonia sp.]|uniref:hypothetical protein n=1 Tax=Leifsonia sp. TaxID=1870902 RepID=UPI003F8116FC